MVTRKSRRAKGEHHLSFTFGLAGRGPNSGKCCPTSIGRAIHRHRRGRNFMFRAGIVGCALLLAVGNSASADDKAESPTERGAYLVNTIMACGNCHTPRDADGKP